MHRCGLAALIVLFAVGADAQLDDAAKKDLQQFQGFWQALAIQQADGRPAAEEDVQATSLLVEGNKFTLKGNNLVISGAFAINPSATPKGIDVVLVSKNAQQTKLLGIYRIQGDTRKSCFALPGKERPTQFSTEPGYIGFEWKRK